MDRELSQIEIKEFITSNGLDKDLLDEQSEALEAWGLKWEGLSKGFFEYIENRFSAIEKRLDRLEQVEGERYGHQKD
jgi:hypothetical protein